MKSEIKCPFCGANFIYEGTLWRFYECNTVVVIDQKSTACGTFQQSPKCRNRQLITLIYEMGGLLHYAGQTLAAASRLHCRPYDEHLEAIIEILNRPDVKVLLKGKL